MSQLLPIILYPSVSKPIWKPDRLAKFEAYVETNFDGKNGVNWVTQEVPIAVWIDPGLKLLLGLRVACCHLAVRVVEDVMVAVVVVVWWGQIQVQSVESFASEFVEHLDKNAGNLLVTETILVVNEAQKADPDAASMLI